MKKIISEKVGSIMADRNRLEKTLKVKLTNRGKEIYIEGAPFDEYEAEKVLEAINHGFSAQTAVKIKTEELAFEVFNIKSYTNRKDLERVRARVIGAKGRTLATLTQLTDCFFEITNNDVGIIGRPEEIKTAQDAIINIIKGSKQANVYKFLEKHHPKPAIDLGLKVKEVLEDKKEGWEDDEDSESEDD